MYYNGVLLKLPKEIKVFVGAFIIVLSVGFYTGLLFVNETSGRMPSGIQENYQGNEEDENAKVMKFKKSKREMLTTVHTHIFSMSFIFFLLGSLVWLARVPKKIKLFLTVEPFLSVVLTFGGIYFLWTGIHWMKYVVIFSGILMTFTFVVSSLIVFFQLFYKSEGHS